jgi:hypothetical protein
VLTPHAALAPDAVRARACYDTVVLGKHGLGYVRNIPEVVPNTQFLLPALGQQMMRFRAAAMRRYSITPYRPDDTKVRIVVLHKDMQHSDHSWGVSNMDEAYHAIREKYTLEMVDVQLVAWPGMPPQTQVELMTYTDIVLTVPGADAMNEIFMPPVSAILNPQRSGGEAWEDPSNENKIWFQNVVTRYIDEWHPDQPPTTVYRLDIPDMLQRVEKARAFVLTNRLFAQK